MEIMMLIIILYSTSINVLFCWITKRWHFKMFGKVNTFYSACLLKRQQIAEYQKLFFKLIVFSNENGGGEV